MVALWDGSDDGLEALSSVIPLFGEQTIEHIEIVLAIWPPRDNAMWADIQERQIITDDLHSAAAEVANEDSARIKDILTPVTQSIATSIRSGSVKEVLFELAVETRGTIVLAVLGHDDPSGIIQKTVQEIVSRSAVPTWVLRAGATGHDAYRFTIV